MKLTLDQKISLAKSTTATPQDLEKLADDEYWSVRLGVTENPNCPVYLLEKLAEDEDWYIRLGVTKNPNCPQYLKDFIKAKEFIMEL